MKPQEQTNCKFEITRKLLLSFTLFLFLVNYSKAQISREWVYDFTAPGIIYGNGTSIVCDQNNNVYAGGYVAGNFSQWPFFMKLSNTGSILYLDTISLGNGGFSLDDLFYDKQSTVYATGQISDSTLTMFIAAYDTMGSRLWLHSYRYNNLLEMLPVEIIKSQGGFLYTAGNYYDSSAHFFVQKADLLGNLIWQVSDTGYHADNTYLSNILVTDSDEIYINGNGYFNGSFSTDVFLGKIDSSGTFVWFNQIDGTAHDDDYSGDIHFDMNHNVLMTAQLKDTSANYYNLSKYNSSGGLIWSKQIFLGGVGVQYKILTDLMNNIYIPNVDLSTGGDMGLSKFDSLGDFIDSTIFNSTNYSGMDISDVAIDDSANIYITANGFSNNSVYDIVTCKVDSALNFIWDDEYLTTNSLGESPSALTLDNNNNIYVTGKSNYDQMPNTANLCVIKYNQGFPTNINTAKSPYNVTIFPNPSRDHVSIDFGSKDKYVEIIITDIAGKIIYSNTAADTQKVELSTKEFDKGVYLVRIKRGEFSETKKLIVQ